MSTDTIIGDGGTQVIGDGGGGCIEGFGGHIGDGGSGGIKPALALLAALLLSGCATVLTPQRCE